MQTAPSIELRESSAPYVVPFVVFLALLAAQDYVPLPQRWEFAIRIAILSTILIVFSRRVISFNVRQPVMTILIGLAVFVIWIGPDALIPGYRSHSLFQNSVTGSLKTSVSGEARSDTLLLVLRSLRATVLVPIIEELFWRAWLMRWLIDRDFWKVRLGTYAAGAFWITAVLFASEHGPYWEVGLIAGVIYNWWMIRTRSLGDLILAHAVTNAALCAYVLVTQKWEYWM